MQPLLVKDILAETKGRLFYGISSYEVKSISIDSRTLVAGDVFIAIKGNVFDGHQFINDAIRRGAAGVIVEDQFNISRTSPCFVIKVKDTVNALGCIAKLCREKFRGPLIAITGTVGKTTTKEFVSTVLQEKFSVHKTQGTLNNHIGVPLTLMGLAPENEAAVLELGMSGLGEIKYLADIARPDVGVVTNIGPAHLEKLGDIENILKAKSELLESIGQNGIVVLNKDDDYFNDLKKKTKCRYITIGKSNGSDFQAVDIGTSQGGFPSFKILAKPFSEILEIKLPIIGMHNIYPALSAVAIGYGLGMKALDIINGLGKVKLPKMRLEIRQIAGIKIIDDCYNANPISMASALETLSMFDDKDRKIFVCSDMLELGRNAIMYHKDLGKLVAKYKINRLITIGELSRFVSETAVQNGFLPENVYHCKNNIEAVEALGKMLEPGDLLLVKGSRGNHLEEITKGIEEYYISLEKLIV